MVLNAPLIVICYSLLEFVAHRIDCNGQQTLIVERLRIIKSWKPTPFQVSDLLTPNARVAEMVDARDLKSLDTKYRASSILAPGTK